MIRIHVRSITRTEYTDLIVRVPFLGRVRISLPVTVRVER